MVLGVLKEAEVFQTVVVEEVFDLMMEPGYMNLSLHSPLQVFEEVS